ncbi:WD40 repeat domain-containing protein [Candidatus Babeliales bacterium]|nr:WD40 repeat domain-containing protein [Candidatus Babeliales bacterium]
MKRSILIFLTYFFYSSTAQCTLDFANRNVHLAMNDGTITKVRLGQVASITGWGQDSIVDTYGNNASTSWTESYTNGVVLGTGRRKAPTNMVYNNSNVINATGSLVRQTSNALVFLFPKIKNNSNTANAMSVITKGNSNANVLLNQKIRNDSNALLFGCKNNSNALRFGIKNNSNAITAQTLTTLIRTNSNVLIYTPLSTLVRTNSNALVSFVTSVQRVINNSNAINALAQNFGSLLIQNSTAINFIGNSIQIVTNHSRFQATTTINKLILYKAGFEVDAGKTLTLMTPLPVSGNIALKSTGKLVLAGDLYLNSNAYITSGGDLAGNNFSLVLSDSLVLSTLTSLKITSSLIIDGNGGTLIFGPHAQIVLESNVSLTLKNVNIQTTRNSSNIPIIRCFDQKGHVTFDNVTLSCADDFPFRTGRMFCFNDVCFTGTSCFIYQSWMQSYVAPQSLLTFDPGTTLYYYPSTTSKDLLQLTDKTSGIYLKGSATTLQTTFTGMSLTKGRLWLDNKVSLNTGPTTRFSSLTQTSSMNVSGSSTTACEWSPDGRFLAVIDPNDANLRIFKITSTGLILVASYATTSPSGFPNREMNWHPSGRFIVLAEVRTVSPTNRVSVLSFNESSLTVLSQVTYSTSQLFSAVWSPCGCYLALFGLANPNTIQVYSFNGKALSTSTVATASFAQISPSFGKHIRWTPDSNYLGVYFNTTTGTITQSSIYRFNGTSLTLQSSSTLTFVSASPITKNIDLRPDGLFFAVCANNTNNTSDPILAAYSFNGSTQNLVDSSLNTSASVPVYYALAWSPDGRYVAVGGAENGNVNNIRIFEFNGASLTSRYTLTIGGGGTSVTYLHWSPDGKSLAAGLASNPGQVIIYQVNYTTESNAQALTNGINFGNSALGSTSDLDVFLLAGARVQLDGKLFYNNVS